MRLCNSNEANNDIMIGAYLIRIGQEDVWESVSDRRISWWQTNLIPYTHENTIDVLCGGHQLHQTVVHVVVTVEADGNSSAAKQRQDGQRTLQQGYRPPGARLPVAASRYQVNQEHQQRQD